MRKGTAVRKLKEQRKIQKQIVFEAIQKEPLGIHTNELIFKTKLKHQSLTARLSDLEQAGLIYQKGLFSREKGKPFTVWQITPAEAIEHRKSENYNKRLLMWLNKGKRNKFVSQKELDFLKKQTSLFG